MGSSKAKMTSLKYEYLLNQIFLLIVLYLNWIGTINTSSDFYLVLICFSSKIRF